MSGFFFLCMYINNEMRTIEIPEIPKVLEMSIGEMISHIKNDNFLIPVCKNRIYLRKRKDSDIFICKHESNSVTQRLIEYSNWIETLSKEFLFKAFDIELSLLDDKETQFDVASLILLATDDSDELVRDWMRTINFFRNIFSGKSEKIKDLIRDEILSISEVQKIQFSNPGTLIWLCENNDIVYEKTEANNIIPFCSRQVI